MENIQVSEVPLPAAFWLFGTALVGGLAFRRNRMKKLSTQAA
ncbi:MAG: PEP-CTERM sorting domain-containing protein [Nitrincola sp.]|nr:PEP-CTERM sorting domain-containing protein [Nitrincola sp.]